MSEKPMDVATAVRNMMGTMTSVAYRDVPQEERYAAGMAMLRQCGYTITPINSSQVELRERVAIALYQAHYNQYDNWATLNPSTAKDYLELADHVITYLAARGERVVPEGLIDAAIALANDFAWSSVSVDTKEATENLRWKIDALRSQIFTVNARGMKPAEVIGSDGDKP